MIDGKIVYLSGGVGGAKLALGLDRVLAPGQLSIIANTGDDFHHLGLFVCPDIDTLVYTLSGEADTIQGWGRQGETGNFMSAHAALGGEDWFFLGDKDLAMHVRRTGMLAAGLTLTEATARLAGHLGVKSRILPMSDDPAPTIVQTDDGPLAFQHYFVRDRAAPVVRGLNLHGADAPPGIPPQVTAALSDPDLAAIIVGPSNPYISIDPILQVPGMTELITRSDVPRIVVSPIVGGDAIKGPTAKMMREFGLQPGNLAIAAHYGDLATTLVIDQGDAADIDPLMSAGANPVLEQTMMTCDADKISLAEHILRRL